MKTKGSEGGAALQTRGTKTREGRAKKRLFFAVEGGTICVVL
jgi:hypothetical protein